MSSQNGEHRKTWGEKSVDTGVSRPGARRCHVFFRSSVATIVSGQDDGRLRALSIDTYSPEVLPPRTLLATLHGLRGAPRKHCGQMSSSTLYLQWLVRPNKVCLFVKQLSTVQTTAAIPNVVGFGHGVVWRSSSYACAVAARLTGTASPDIVRNNDAVHDD